MKKHRCCTDAADVGNTSHSGEARRNEMVPMASLSLMPLGTVTCSTEETQASLQLLLLFSEGREVQHVLWIHN